MLRAQVLLDKLTWFEPLEAKQLLLDCIKRSEQACQLRALIVSVPNISNEDTLLNVLEDMLLYFFQLGLGPLGNFMALLLLLMLPSLLAQQLESFREHLAPRVERLVQVHL